jgi:hypothetical protein
MGTGSPSTRSWRRKSDNLQLVRDSSHLGRLWTVRHQGEPARVLRYRDDKTAEEADTVETVRSLRG